MKMEPAGFSSLPVEIIWAIAGYSTPEALVQLLQAIPSLDRVLMPKYLTAQRGALTDSILHILAREDNLELLERLLKCCPNTALELEDAGVHISAMDEHRRTAAHYAAENKNNAMMRLFIEYGTDLTAIDENRWNLLHLAAMTQNESMVRDIILHAAAAHPAQSLALLTPDVDLNTPLCFAVSKGESSMTRLLIDTAVAAKANSALGRALATAADTGRSELIEPLIHAGADVSYTKYRAWQPLHYAASEGHAVAVSLLLKAGANSWARTPENQCILALAAEQGHVDVLRVIVGAEPDIQSEAMHYRISDALIAAAADGRLDAVRFLMELDTGGDGERAAAKICATLKCALDSRHADIVQYLLDVEGERFAKRTGPRFATALRTAVDEAPTDVVRVLLDTFKTPEYLDCEIEWGEAAIHTAVRREESRRGRLRMLLDAGANASLQNQYGCTPLHCAAQYASLAAARILLEHKPDLTARDWRGFTPLRAAVDWNRDQLVKALIAAGADTALKDNEGLTPLDVAHKRGYQRIADLFTNTPAMHPVSAEGGSGGG